MNRQTSQFELVLKATHPVGRHAVTRPSSVSLTGDRRFASIGIGSDINAVRRLIEKELISATLSILAYASCPSSWNQCTIDAFETIAVTIVCSENSNVAVVD